MLEISYNYSMQWNRFILEWGLRILLVLLVLSFLLIFYLKYFEKTGVFFPSRQISITPKDMGLDYEEVFLQSPDDLTIHGWFCKANQDKGTILFFHGNAGNISHRLELIRKFIEVNLNVFIIDYRGYGKSQGKTSENGLYLDALWAYNYLVKEKNIPPKKIFLYGESLGAAVAIDLASRIPVGAVIIQGGFSSGLDMAKVIFPWVPRLLIKLIGGIKFSSDAKIKNIKAPMLFIHSKEDEVVPFSLGEKLFKLAPLPKELYVIRGGHNDCVYLEPNYTLKIREFIERHTP